MWNPQFWNERYEKPEYSFGTEPNDFLVSVAAQIPQGRVLCLGEGEGRNAVYLASLGYEVVAVDQSAVGLAKASQLAAERGVEIQTIVADLGEFAFEPQSWQGVVSIFCHLPSALWQQVCQRAIGGLEPGGMFVLEAYTPRQLDFKTGGPSDPDWLVSLATAQAKLTGLDWKIAREVEREVIEGAAHNGKASVVQLLGAAL
jgi:SAM-dependent methyltransferase